MAAARVLRVKEAFNKISWNKFLLVPLGLKETVLVDTNQSDVDPKYIRIKHGPGKKTVSIFSKKYFIKVS